MIGFRSFQKEEHLMFHLHGIKDRYFPLCPAVKDMLYQLLLLIMEYL